MTGCSLTGEKLCHFLHTVFNQAKKREVVEVLIGLIHDYG